MGKKMWTSEEELKLMELYQAQVKLSEIAEILHKTKEAISTKAYELGLTKQFIKKNNINYKADYQEYDWIYERFINRHMTDEEMAKEANCSVRTIKKWRVEKHRIFLPQFKSNHHLTELQRQIIIFGTLGDGHIVKRENEPMYIESHASDEKDYIFWKYEILKDICNSEPTYYSEKYSNFSTDKEYLCKPYYRLGTKIMDDIGEIRNISRIDKIKMFNELGICLHCLDDGCRKDVWEVCLAEWTQEEKELYLRIMQERFSLIGKIRKDNRYIHFDAESSRTIDDMILKNIPNDLDIVHKKIIDNPKIPQESNCKYIVIDNKQIGLYRYCKENKYNYKKLKEYFIANDIRKMSENELIEVCRT